MERNREARRGTLAAVNGLSRRRQRSSYRESLDEDGGMEMKEMGRLRDRGSKKDRARDRSGRSKRRRVDRHASNRDEGESSSDDSNNDDDEDALETSVPVRLPPPPLNSGSAVSVSHNHRRKSLTAADEMIGVPVPRKARSSSGKRSHEFSAGGGGDPIHASPARPSPPSSTQMLPSSSTASARKKMKPIGGNGGSKHRREKVNKSPSVSEDLEIEVAEVLFGLTRQFQPRPEPETDKLDLNATNGSNNEANASSSESNSRVSSPISIWPQPAEPHTPVLPPSNPSSNAMPTTAPEGERHRLARLEGESVAVPSTIASSSAAKMDSSRFAMVEASLSRSEKKTACLTMENGTDRNDLGVPQSGKVTVDIPQDSAKLQNNFAQELKISLGDSNAQDRGETKQKEASPSMKECPPLSLNINIDNSSVAKVVPADESSRKSLKFSFDLMVPTLGKPLSDREGLSNYGSTDHKAKDTDIQTAPEGEIGNVEDGKQAERSASMETDEARLEARTANSVTASEVDLMKTISEERAVDLQLAFNKPEKDNLECNKQQVQKQPPNVATMEPDRAAPLQLPMSVEGWPGKPGSFPSFGFRYMAQVPPLQAVVPGDRTIGGSKPIQRPNFLPTENRPKQLATHCHIAQNIYYHQQLSRRSPGQPAAAGAMPLYGLKHPEINAEKHYNLNAAPPSEPSIPGNSIQGNIETSNLGQIPEKAGKLPAAYASHSTKENSSTGNAFAEAALRKQLVFQQAPQPGPVGNMLHGPAFIFPISQQQTAAAAAHFGSSKPIPGNGDAETYSNAASSSGASGPAMSFNYPVLPTNEAHYMSLLQNNGYPFHIPAHAGAPAVYNGGCAVQPVPFFNGHLYSQMLPPQLQQHQRQQASSQQPSNSHAEMGHQSTSASSGSSSSQKAPQQSQHARGGDPTGTVGTSLGFSASKQQWQHLAPQCETGTESPSTADSMVMQAQKNIYGHNLAMAAHPQNYAFVSPAAAVAAAALGSGSGTRNEKQQPTSQHQAMKVDLTTPQAFAFASAAAAAPLGLDLSSTAHNHALFQNLPEAAKHEYRMSAAATAAAAGQASLHMKQHHQIVEDGKSTGDSTKASTGQEERKTITWAKSLGNVPQHPVNISELDTDPPNCTIPGNSNINSSSRTLNLIRAPPANGNRLSNRAASSAPPTSNAPTAPASPNSQQQQQHQQLIQLQKHQQQQQQILQMHHKFSNHSMMSSTTNNSTAIYSDQFPSGCTMSKFPQARAAFPQSFLQNSGTAQSLQWKTSNRETTPAPASSPATSSSKNQVAQQQGRSMQQSPLMPGHQTQVSFNARLSLKPPAAAGQQHLSAASSNRPLSAVVTMASGSPQSPPGKTSGGSPLASSSSKPGATHSNAAALPLQPQQQQSGKNSPSSRSSHSNAPSILGQPPMTTTMNMSAKQQQQMQKQQFPQALFFSNAYLQAQTSQPNGAPAALHYLQRRPSEEQSQQVLQNSPSGGSTTADTVKAAAAAATASNMKAMAIHQHPTQFGSAPHSSSNPFMSAASTFPYMRSMPSASTTTKASDQNPIAKGNDNLHASWPPEKK